MKSPNKLTGWRRFLGIPYKHLGRDWKGLDCYGLLMLYCKEVLGVELRDWWYEENWSKNGNDYFTENYQQYAYRVDKPKRHDVVLICSDINAWVPNHVGILVEEPNVIIQALRSGVVRGNLYSPLIINRTEGFYRIRTGI